MISKNTSGYQKNSPWPCWRAASLGNVSDLGGIHSTANGSGRGGAGGVRKHKQSHESHEEESDEALEEHCESGFRKEVSFLEEGRKVLTLRKVFIGWTVTNSWQEIYVRRRTKVRQRRRYWVRSVFPWFEDELETIETLEEWRVSVSEWTEWALGHDSKMVVRFRKEAWRCRSERRRKRAETLGDPGTSY